MFFPRRITYQQALTHLLGTVLCMDATRSLCTRLKRRWV